MILAEISPEKDASAFLGLGVIGNGSQPALTLVAECLELRHEVAGAVAKALKRYRDADAALLIALDEAGLFEIRQQHLANPCRYAG
jgi:hypothetical protein